ncbi:MAG: helix-turn-helix transcriptional regulator [Mogibacterium sp.]|nr:helix-turn-helix transcriptional regulator [Mogibacterium sp.]
MQLRLRELREARKITQQTVADSIGCSAVAYSRYETGQREPSIDILIKLSDFYGVSVDYIIGRSDPSDATLSEYELSLVKSSRDADELVREIVLEVLQARPKRI